jgi:hypothetical protein
LFPSQFFEIGASIIIIPVISPPVSFEEIFRHSMMLTCHEWLMKYVKNDLEHFAPYDRRAKVVSARIPYSDQRHLHLTELGQEGVHSFPNSALKNKMLCNLSEDDYLKMRPSLAKSLSLSCVLRHLFNAPYPSMQKCFGNVTSNCIPLLHSDYDHGMITSTEPAPYSSFRMSPNLVVALGTSLNGECLLTMAVVAKTLTKNIESIRSFLEAMIGDEDFDAERKRSLEDMIQTRTILEERFLTLCPPRVAKVSTATAQEWLTDIEQFIAKACDPWGQPIEAIPWF